MKTEAPKGRLEGAKRSVAGEPKLLKTWRPLLVLTMASSVLFQEYTCLLPVSPAPRAPPTVILFVALPPYAVNPSTAHHENWYISWNLDILIVWALAKVGETSRAHELLEGLKFRLIVSKMNKKKQQMMQKGFSPEKLCMNTQRVTTNKLNLDLLGSDFNAFGYKIIGASDGQIDVFNGMWCQLY
ncbi:hypothetical protein Bca101_066796 [Brassica carinata]